MRWRGPAPPARARRVWPLPPRPCEPRRETRPVPALGSTPPVLAHPHRRERQQIASRARRPRRSGSPVPAPTPCTPWPVPRSTATSATVGKTDSSSKLPCAHDPQAEPCVCPPRPRRAPDQDPANTAFTAPRSWSALGPQGPRQSAGARRKRHIGDRRRGGRPQCPDATGSRCSFPHRRGPVDSGRRILGLSHFRRCTRRYAQGNKNGPAKKAWVAVPPPQCAVRL
ncbi:hypothetical protein SALBM311S_00011 [Streptomyces alboniger]